MTEPTSTGSTLDSSTAVAATPVSASPVAVTPQTILSWNRYIDRFVLGFVLALIGIACIRPITQSTLWGHLRAGEAILKGGSITTDSFSFTRNGERWVNIPWIFEVTNATLYRNVERIFQNPEFPERGAFAAASALVLLNALLVVMAAIAISTIRHPGPGLWWIAVCLLLALGGIFSPSGTGFQPAVGGIAIGKFAVDPESWGLVLLALELVVLFRGSMPGRSAWLWSLPLIFALWANISATFAFGLLLLAAWGLGHFLDRFTPGAARRTVEGLLSPVVALGVFGVSLLACLLNPSYFYAVPAAFKPLTDILLRWSGQTKMLLTDEVGFLDALSRDYFNRTGGPGTANAFLLFYALIVLSVLGSFALNWRRFSLPRFLMFVVAALIWAGLIRMAPQFALVFAVVLGLNGQEWFQDTFGTEGHTGSGWKLFSDGGRALTILATCGFVALAVTGYRSVDGDVFGLGNDDSKLSFETADFLRSSGIQGNVLGLNRSIGDAMLWRDPKHPVFIDNRSGLYGSDNQAELDRLRVAIRDGDKATWSAILDKYGDGSRPVSAVVVPQEYSTTYKSMMNSPDWIPLFDGGNSVVFGRADRQDLPDLATFQSRRAQPDVLAYHGNTMVGGPERPPTASTWLDGILQYRALRPPHPLINSGGRWLTNPSNPDVELDPAHCLLAIRNARMALVKNPDDSAAYELLSQAYNILGGLESQILVDANPKSARPIPPTYANFRYRQRVAALNFAVATAAPPTNSQAVARMGALQRELAGLYDSHNAFDLERTHLEAARKLMGSTFPDFLDAQLTRIEEQSSEFQNQLSDYAAANSANLVQQANLASQGGYPGLAIQNFLDAESGGFNLAQLRFALVDLYCQTGQPDKAFDLLEGTTANDESLGVDGPTPGLKMARAGYRNGLVNMLLGNYPIAARYWNNYTLPFVRTSETDQALSAAQSVIRGDVIPGLKSVLDVAGTPEQPGLIETYSAWQAELGLCKLEAGAALDMRDTNGALQQEGAATHFLRALEIQPRSPLRPLLVYYLEKMEVAVPPLPEPEPPLEITKPQAAPEVMPAVSSVPETPAPPEAPATEPGKPEEPTPASPTEPKPAAEPENPVTTEPPPIPPAEPEPAAEPAAPAPTEPAPDSSTEPSASPSAS